MLHSFGGNSGMYGRMQVGARGRLAMRNCATYTSDLMVVRCCVVACSVLLMAGAGAGGISRSGSGEEGIQDNARRGRMHYLPSSVSSLWDYLKPFSLALGLSDLHSRSGSFPIIVARCSGFQLFLVHHFSFSSVYIHRLST